MKRFVAACTLLVPVLGPHPWISSLSAQDPITPPEVHQLARTIQEEIEVIRWHMGRPLEERPTLRVEGVAIRENFGLAMNLWRKVNQLAIEMVGGGEVPPVVMVPPGGEYGPEHVYEVLDGVLDRLGEIRLGTEIVSAAGMAGEPPALEVDPSATPSDVFEVLLRCSQQVNRMLERQAQPGDVYQRVRQATFYASEILAAVGDPEPFPALEVREPGLQPLHVFGRLFDVSRRLGVAFEALGLQLVDWPEPGDVMGQETTPSDVFDLATLILSELEYLHSRVPGARVPIQAEHPGHRWPSDVYQEAGVLSDQVLRIMYRAQTNPAAFGGT